MGKQTSRAMKIWQEQRSRILPSRARLVRVNKSEVLDDAGASKALVAKSRIVVPGHLDKALNTGDIRSDAPTDSQLGIYLMLTTKLR